MHLGVSMSQPLSLTCLLRSAEHPFCEARRRQLRGGRGPLSRRHRHLAPGRVCCLLSGSRSRVKTRLTITA